LKFCWKGKAGERTQHAEPVQSPELKKSAEEKTMMRIIAGMGIAWIVIWILALVGYVHHLVYCFQHHEWIRLFVLAFLAPLGSIDGWGLWFGWWN
jgi:hypothetical protein